MSDQEPIHQKELPNIYDVIAFHLPILLLGGLVVMPIIYSVLSTFGLLGEDLSELILSYSPGNLILLSITSLLPSMIAYGRDLQFNLWRFFVGIAIVVILGLRSYAQLKASVSLPLPIGGGFIGIIVASALGWSGLHIRKRFLLKKIRLLKKIGWYALFGLAFLIGIIVIGNVVDNLIATRIWDVQTAIKWAPTWRKYFKEVANIHGTGEVIDVQPYIRDGQLLSVRLKGGEILLAIQEDRDKKYEKSEWKEYAKPWCKISKQSIGNRIRFEGTYLPREYAIRKIKSGKHGDIDMNSEVGLLDATPCTRFNGTIDHRKLEKI